MNRYVHAKPGVRTTLPTSYEVRKRWMVNLDGSRGIGRNRNDRLNSIQGHLHYIPIISQKADNGLKRHFGTKLNDCANDTVCHGTPCPPCPHAPDHLRSSPTSSAYTPVSLRSTLCKLAQPRHSCHRTKLGSMSNFPGLSPYVSGHCLFVFFSICHICLMHFH